jgi:MYXO-CTERM domain-containing protein
MNFSTRALVSKPGLAWTVLLVGVLAPSAAQATQSAELYRTQAYFYGRFEARVRYAPGDGAVSSFFLWRDGSSSTTSWNELDFEKINSDCRLQTNIWTGKAAQSVALNTPAFNICNDYHTYAFEWTPDYIAWLIDGTQVRKVTGASVTDYTQNASQGMTFHFNLWAGDSSFGGNLNASTLPVRQYISWVQYSSYTNGTFQMQWREEFDGGSTPSGWMTGNWTSPLNHSTHNPANVSYVNGIAVLSMTADGATGFTGTPPADGTSGAGGASGSSGAAGTSGAAGAGGGGVAGRGGTSGGAGATGRGGTPATGGASATGGRSGGGGTSATGGTLGTAGASATGGAPATGGTPGSAGGPAIGGAPGTGGTSPTGGTTGTAGASSPSGAAGGNPTGTGAAGTGAGQAGSSGQTGSDGGCSCDVNAARGSHAAAALLLLAVAIAARRRRRASRP